MKKFFAFLLIILLLISGVYYFFNNKHREGTVKFVDQNKVYLKIDNTMPLNDKSAIKKSAYVDFSIKSFDIVGNSIKYELYAKSINGVNSINSDYIKLNLFEQTTNRPLMKEPIVFSDLKILDDNVNSKQLYSGSIKKNETIKFRVRMWLADNYTVNNEKKNFEIALGVRAIK